LRIGLEAAVTSERRPAIRKLDAQEAFATDRDVIGAFGLADIALGHHARGRDNLGTRTDECAGRNLGVLVR
jgi:hypothetical protein